MTKLIAAINMTIDGFCDHTAMVADDELHDHYTELLRDGSAVMYGRITYQLMESYWPGIVKNPTGNKSTDEFAVAIENIPKIVFSKTITDAGWKNARLANQGLKEEVLVLKQSARLTNKPVFAGSPSMITALTKLDLIDEYQLCVHPVIAGSGLPLFKDIQERIVLKLLKTKTFGSGAMIHYFEPAKRK